MTKWTKDRHNYLIDLKLSGKYTWQEIADKMTDKFNDDFTRESCRARWRTNRHKIKVDPKEKYTTKITKNADGTIETDQLIEISKEQLKDEKYILKAHGYDDGWDIVSHQFSMWNHFNKELTTPKTLYASKLRVRPKENKISYDDLINKITEQTKPVKTSDIKYKVKDKRMLEISLMDMHFGVNTFDDYKGTLARIKYHLERNVWQRIIITFGSDLLHVDNLKNTTRSEER